MVQWLDIGSSSRAPLWHLTTVIPFPRDLGPFSGLCGDSIHDTHIVHLGKQYICKNNFFKELLLSGWPVTVSVGQLS